MTHRTSVSTSNLYLDIIYIHLFYQKIYTMDFKGFGFAILNLGKL
jgi:hypothetical protein